MTFYRPCTCREFRAAILEARPGDVIRLHPKEYLGTFILGPLQFLHFGEELPITIEGSFSSDFRKTTTIVAPRNFGTAIFITGGKWRLSGLNVISEYAGVHIRSNGHTLRDINFRRTGYAVIITGDNNQIEDVKISGSSVAISILGNGNCVRNSVLSQIKVHGVVICQASTGNTIETTTVLMKKTKRNKTSLLTRLRAYVNPFRQREWGPLSLALCKDSNGTQVKRSRFSGVAYMHGDGGQVKGCKFIGLNLVGNGNEFLDTEICKLFRYPEEKDNTFLASNTIKEIATRVLGLD